MLTLLEWVEEQRREGIDDAEIGMQLIQQGYHDNDIAEALRSPFHVEDDPKFVKFILTIGFGSAILCFLILLLTRPIFEASVWGILFITFAGIALLRYGQFWQRPKQIMAGLLTLMSLIILGAGFSGVRWMAYTIILILTPMTAYIGFQLLLQSRSNSQDIIHTGQRPMVLLALLFLGLEIFAVLTRESIFNTSIANSIMQNARYINIHIGFVLAAVLFFGVYIKLFNQKYRVNEKKDLYLYYYSIIGYTIGAVIIELLALL